MFILTSPSFVFMFISFLTLILEPIMFVSCFVFIVKLFPMFRFDLVFVIIAVSVVVVLLPFQNEYSSFFVCPYVRFFAEEIVRVSDSIFALL